VCGAQYSISKYGMFFSSYQPVYQIESTVFFSHNKTTLASLSTGFNISRTGQQADGPPAGVGHMEVTKFGCSREANSLDACSGKRYHSLF